MIPSRRLLLLSLGPLVLGMLALWVPSMLAPQIAADVVLLLLCGADAALGRRAVQAARVVAPVQAVGRAFDVTLRLSLGGRGRARAVVHDDAPGTAVGVPLVLDLNAGTTEVPYSVTVDHRGAHAFGPVTVRLPSMLGLFIHQQRVEVTDSVRVYPNFAQLRHAGMKAREAERRLPVRVRRRPGGENDFQRLRPYVQGDAFRHVDWRATARKRELITREFGQESNQNVILLLDSGRMMSAQAGGMTAFDHALNAALMVGQTALRHGDRVGLLAFDGQVRAWLPPRAGKRSGARLIRGLYDVFPSLEEPDYALAFRHLSTRVRRRSLVVLFTSVVDGVNEGLTRQLVAALARRHVPLCVWIRDPEVERLLHDRDVDPYVRGAAASLAAWREGVMKDLTHRGALVVDGDPETLTPTLLSRYLEIKARRLL